jgi:hypothetical protein
MQDTWDVRVLCDAVPILCNAVPVLCDAVPDVEHAGIYNYFASGLSEHGIFGLAFMERLRAHGWRLFDARENMTR